jgi:hypothetical protein
MNLSVFGFAVMAIVAVVFAFATLAREMDFPLRNLTQTGDSSISRRSVNWLAATALLSALFICFVLM